MDYKDLYPKLNEVLESISAEELSSFARSYALCNKDMALALIERYWQPDAADYRQVVDACFVHPFVVSTKFGESLDWNAVIEDVLALMQKIRVDKDGKDIIGAAQMALYLFVRTCEEYVKDHPYEDFYDETWRERWHPLMDAVRECHKIVCELLVVGVYIDDRTKRCIADCKRSKDYAYHVQRIQDMIDACEGGKIVARELIPYLSEHYGNRPALIGMLRQLKGLEDYGNEE